MNPEGVRRSYRSIAHHSKSFAMASRLLPPAVRDRAVVVYAWCRRADDAVDHAGAGNEERALAGLFDELDRVYADGPLEDPLLEAFRSVTRERGIPVSYPRDLLEGMRMDVDGTSYDDMGTLLRYCWCVAGIVGLLMCHVMGLRDERATRNAVHLGIAMQITNICRDVMEDWERGRLYIPETLLARAGVPGLGSRLGGPFPDEAAVPVAAATDRLLDIADRYYASGDAGIPALSWRCALSVRTARRVYSEIGARVRAQDCDPRAGRAIVPRSRKLGLAAGALTASVVEIPARLQAGSAATAAPRSELHFPADVLPV
jgi:phytoene synthase